MAIGAQETVGHIEYLTRWKGEFHRYFVDVVSHTSITVRCSLRCRVRLSVYVKVI